MLEKFKQSILSLLTLISLLCLGSAATIPPTFVTTIASSFETGTAVLTASTLSTNATASSYSTTLTYLNTYVDTPNCGYGLGLIYSQWPQTSTATEMIFDVSNTTANQAYQIIQLSFTISSISLFSINYIACATSFFLDVQTAYFDLTSTNIGSSSLVSMRSYTLNIPSKTKSNSSNSVAVYTTIGLSMMRSKDTFEFQLTTLGYTYNTTNVNLTVMGNNGMHFIRLSIFNYEAVVTVISSPYFIDIGFGSNLGGSVPDSSGLSLATTGTIFLGMTDWAMSDSYAVLSYNMTITGKTYSLGAGNTATRTQTAYIWYRQAVCPNYYYNQSNMCAPCHYSCLTCFSATATGCTSCDSAVTFRNFLSANKSCPCKNKYTDPGSAICQEILCNNYCLCSSDYVCSSCNSGTYRTLINGSCTCGDYTLDLYALDNVFYQACQACWPTCLTCSLFYNPNACLSCNLARDHRSFNASQFTCYCIDGYFENPKLTALPSSFTYKGAPCLACQYSCSTCNDNITCLTCNSSLNRVYNSVSKLCSCLSGFYDNFLVQSCFSCPYSCTTCTSQTVCLSCPNTRTLTNSLCPCNAGYFEAGIATCQACNYNC